MHRRAEDEESDYNHVHASRLRCSRAGDFRCCLAWKARERVNLPTPQRIFPLFETLKPLGKIESQSGGWRSQEYPLERGPPFQLP